MRQTVTENRLFSKKDLRKLIIPLILEQTLAITVGMADTMMISSAGEAAVSGVSLVDMFNNLIISVLAALATGGAVVTSQCIGAGRREEACRSARQLVFTEAAITIGISVLVLLFHRQILGLFFGQIEADVMQNAIIYLIISVFSFPLLAVYDSCAALYRSMGNAQITLKISLLMNVINVVGNAIGVYVLKLGVAGVAIPSLVSRGVAGVVLFTFLHNPDNLVFLTRGKFKVDATIVKRILFIGIPSGIENGIFQLGRVLVVSIIAAFGTSQIAANGVANSLDSMGCIVGQAMSLAMITVIGRCVGAGEEGQVRYYTKKLLGEKTTRLSYILVMIHDGMAIFLWPASFVLPNMLRACNDVKYTMVVSIFSMITFRIGFSYLFGVHMGWMAVGVWAAMVIDWVFRVLCFVGRYLAGTWRKKCGLVAPTA